MNLPAAFTERMKNDLKSEYDSFLKSYEDEPTIALRVNTLKLSVEDFQNTVGFCGEKVDWCPTGFYYDGKKGNHPASIAGLFYSQEPSAQIAAELVDVQKGDRVLDLCAAPGGKSTQLAAKLMGEGLLVSNEVVGNRAKILCENIERMGIKNAVVINMYPEKMERLFPEFFDKIVVDAPCSGEGMFRKDDVAVQEWSIEHTFSCASRQLSILDSAYKMLAPGGKLVYSTCTFAGVENEDVAESFAEKYPDIKLVEMHRLMPHKIKGEGHFSALFEKDGEKEAKNLSSPASAKKEMTDAFRTFEKENLNTSLDGNFVSFGEFLYLLPKEMVSLDKIKCVRPGLCLGEVRKGRFIPSHHLCMALKKDDFKRSISLSDEEVSMYIKGETIMYDGEKGYGAMLYNEKFPIGWYKLSDGYAKNHYPKHLRKA